MRPLTRCLVAVALLVTASVSRAESAPTPATPAAPPAARPDSGPSPRSGHAPAPAGSPALPSGEHGAQFVHHQAGKTVPVFYFVPPGATKDAPVMIALHGFGRNAEEFFGQWLPTARNSGFILVVPYFSDREFPGETYITGRILDAKGAVQPPEQWTFSTIDPIFEKVRELTGNTTPGYILYGHSAGAQFVHRFLYFMPRAKLRQAVLANAGWYTMPDLAAAYPYGLKGTPAGADDLRRVLAHPLVVILGMDDTDPNSGLRHSPEADAQGPNRFTRGNSFFARAAEMARVLKVPFNWKRVHAPGLGHSDTVVIPFVLSNVPPLAEGRRLP